DTDATPQVATGNITPPGAKQPIGALAFASTGSWSSTGLPLSPRSIGSDGWVYGSYNSTQMWRSGDGLATRSVSTHTFTGKQIHWVSRTAHGYVALIINAASPNPGNGEWWHSTDWD